MNVDGCRLSAPDAPDLPELALGAQRRFVGVLNGGRASEVEPRTTSASAAGRWPANVALSHLDGCRELGARKVRPASHGGGMDRGSALGAMNDDGWRAQEREPKGPAVDGSETVTAWDCATGCQVAALDAQAGPRKSGIAVLRNGGGNQIFGSPRSGGPLVDGGYTDEGGASRFFFTAKPSTAEREAGCEHLPKKTAGELVDREEGSAGMGPRAGAGRTSSGRANFHPTVKPIDLMRWLCRLVTPPGGLVVDHFAGSGTTGCACVLEGFRFIGFDLDTGEDGEPLGHVAIALARIAHWAMGGRKKTKAPPVPAEQGALFDIG